MSIPDSVANSIVYLADAAGVRGTGFILELPYGRVAKDGRLEPRSGKHYSFETGGTVRSRSPYFCIVTARHVAECVMDTVVIHANSWEGLHRFEAECARFEELVSRPTWASFASNREDNERANQIMRETAKRLRNEHGFPDKWEEMFDVTERKIEFAIDSPQWHFHPSDEAVDLAVLPFDPPQELEPEDHGFIAPSMLPRIHSDAVFRPESRPKKRPRNPLLGETVHVVGLLSFCPGDDRILPIVRTGNIALIPDDRIPPIGAMHGYS